MKTDWTSTNTATPKNISMRNRIIIIVTALVVITTGCYKDKGNYDYNVPEEPIVTNLDTVYSVFVGDSLIIKPTVAYTDPAMLRFDWKIAIASLRLRTSAIATPASVPEPRWIGRKAGEAGRTAGGYGPIMRSAGKPIAHVQQTSRVSPSARSDGAAGRDERAVRSFAAAPTVPRGCLPDP